MPNDNKYIISSSVDNTIRVWNPLEKRQESVLQEHTSQFWTVIVTNDNKYIISGSLDKTIRIWNLLQKTQQSILQGYTSCINML